VKRPKSRAGSLVELVVIVAVAVGLALLIQAFVVKPYRIPSGSMEPTLSIGQRVLVNRIDMDFSEPHVGEIAVFHPPEGAEQQECGPTPHVIRIGLEACSQPIPTEASVNFIKRIVAGPGDEIYVREGHVYRRAAGTSRFVRERDPYIKECGASAECNFLTPTTADTGARSRPAGSSARRSSPTGPRTGSGSSSGCVQPVDAMVRVRIG